MNMEPLTITFTIIFLGLTFTMVFTLGKMLIADIKSVFFFNPGKITFKDKKDVWTLTECERKSIIDPKNHSCNHTSKHNLLNYFVPYIITQHKTKIKENLEIIKKPQIVKYVMSGKFNKNTDLKEYYKGRK